MRSGSRCPAFYGEIPPMRWGILNDDGGYFYCITYIFLEYTAPRALALLERALIEGSKPMHYGTIQVTQGEERVVAQLRDDGRREIADCTLNRSFVARCKYARRQQRRVVMLSQLFVGYNGPLVKTTF